MYDLDRLECHPRIVKLMNYSKNRLSYDSFKPLEVKCEKAEETVIRVFYLYFERRKILVYNDSKCTFLKHVIMGSKRVLLNHILKLALM